MLGIISIVIVVVFSMMLSTSYAWYSFENASTSFQGMTNDDDIIIMCSDGLSNYISDEGILEFVRQYKANNLTNALVEEAKQQGGRDNITVAVIYANNIRE